MKNTSLYLSNIIVSLLFLTISCGVAEHNHNQATEHDYPTTVSLQFVNQNIPYDTVTIQWKDIDGPGGEEPKQIDTLVLQKNAYYLGTIQLFNESKSPAINITDEINEYSYEHQFFYELDSNSRSEITWIATDKDKNLLPVGLLFSVQTKARAVSNGTVNIVLSHYDSTPKDGISKSLESDIDINFPIHIQ